MSSLKHRWPEQKVKIEFRHDVFVFLFGGKGKPAEQRNWTAYKEQDFVKCKLPPNWSSVHDLYSDGMKVRFLVKMRAFAHLRTITKKERKLLWKHPEHT